jgi:hypothetical protein
MRHDIAALLSAAGFRCGRVCRPGAKRKRRLAELRSRRFEPALRADAADRVPTRGRVWRTNAAASFSGRLVGLATRWRDFRSHIAGLRAGHCGTRSFHFAGWTPVPLRSSAAPKVSRPSSRARSLPITVLLASDPAMIHVRGLSRLDKKARAVRSVAAARADL